MYLKISKFSLFSQNKLLKPKVEIEFSKPDLLLISTEVQYCKKKLLSIRIAFTENNKRLFLWGRCTETISHSLIR